MQVADQADRLVTRSVKRMQVGMQGEKSRRDGRQKVKEIILKGVKRFN